MVSGRPKFIKFRIPLMVKDPISRLRAAGRIPSCLIKSVLFKNKSNSLVNLHDSAPYFGACLPEIWGGGQDRANYMLQ